MVQRLRDVLLDALARLPGKRRFHVHVLISSPRRHGALFPFAKPRPKVYIQDILVLISEQATPDAPRVLVTGVEACVYNIPSTSCAILYVSKVDSTGQATAPSPTATVVHTLLSFYADPTTRPISAAHLWIHLFARAQAQYLFPNSSEYSRKRPLSDIRLCAWWRRVLSSVAAELEARLPPKHLMRLYYVLPGYNEMEATQALKLSPGSSAVIAPPWIYGHPYSQTEIPLPCPLDGSSAIKNLGHFIPSFDDDPKSRFMDEMAYTTDGDIRSPARKRSRTNSNREDTHGKDGKDKVAAKDDRPLGELGKVTPDEFWERMSFRQECVAGAVTGFFVMAISTPPAGHDAQAHSEASSPTPQPGQVSSQINKRIMTSLTTNVEFSTTERAARATEVLENAIKGLCEGVVSLPDPARVNANPEEEGRHTPERGDSSSSQPNLLAPPRTPPRNVASRGVLEDVSPNPFPEPVTSLDTYLSHIYGSVSVDNLVATKDTKEDTVASQEGSEQPKAHVTVLTARKKKKRTE